jgi:hypothetical protein
MPVKDRNRTTVDLRAGDLHFIADKPLSAYTEDARIKGRIVT